MFPVMGMFDRSLGMTQPGADVPFSVLKLFSGGVQGVWYDPSDFSTMFQDSAGTTPVTAVEQPVGLILDKSQTTAAGLYFKGLSQTTRGWYGMTTLGSDVYACVYNGDIYKQTGGTGNFVALDQTARNWVGMTTLGSDVYCCVIGGDIYKQTGGTGNFVALGQTTRNWWGMTTLGSDVYCSVVNGDIYKQTGGTGNFVALGQTSRTWEGMTTLGSDVYGSVHNGDIYKQTGGTGNFVALGQTSRSWRGMTTLGSDVYCAVDSGDIYKQTGGTGNFVALGQASRSWLGLTSLGSSLYACVYSGDIYKPIYNNAAYQSTSAARPVLSARYNQLLATETLSTQSVTATGLPVRNWVCMTTLGSDVYCCVYPGDIYKQAGGTGNFVALGQTTRYWRGITYVGSDVYACVYGGDIYKQTGGTGNFVALGQTTRNWMCMTSLGSDVYCAVEGGDIYKQTGGTGNFVALGQTSRTWVGMTTLGSDVYASAYSGDIYKQTGGTGGFVALGQTARSWRDMTTLGSDVYCSVVNGDIYKQTGGTGNFVAIGYTTRGWYGLTSLGSNLYASVTGGHIYKQTGGTGDLKLTGGTAYTLKFTGTGTIALSGITVGTYSSGSNQIELNDGTLTLTVSGTITQADLRMTNDGVGLPTYQRVTTATDYDTTGFPPYLNFDGVDDCLVTPTIDYTSKSTDAVTVWVGLRKNSDSAQGVALESSATIASNNGTFLLTAPNSAAANYNFSSKGTAQSDNTITTYTSPLTSVLSAAAKISTDANSVKVNGGIAIVSTTDQGTGNYLSYAMYIGRRNNASLQWNGRIYSLIIRAAESTGKQISDAEKWVNSMTKAY